MNKKNSGFQPLGRRDYDRNGVGTLHANVPTPAGIVFSLFVVVIAALTLVIPVSKKQPSSSERTVDDFLNGKTDHARALFHHFVEQFRKVGNITLHPAKTMIGIATPRKRIAYITQLGKNFIHVVFPFQQPYRDNLCFQKMAQVPGEDQYNHHFRMLLREDINEEVIRFMKLAYRLGS